MPSWRYLAYRLNGDGTETLLHPELPLSNVRVLETLSAASVITGTLKPEILGLRDPITRRPIIEPWSTAIYAEADGVIRDGGIVTETPYKDSETDITAVGFLEYPRGQAWVDPAIPFYDTDPAYIWSYIWSKLQAHEGANLGLTWDTITTGVRVGKRASGEGTSATSDEPLLLAPYSTNDLGQVLEQLLADGNIEAREQHAWDGETVSHHISLAYPRRGRRISYRYVIGENVIEVPQIDPNADMYASEVTVIGAGEGPAAIIQRAATATRTRLRRSIALSRQDLGTTAAVAGYANSQLARRQVIHDNIDQLIIRDTPYAPLSAIQTGDELNLTGDAGWAGNINMWVRIISLEYSPETNDHASAKVVSLDKVD